MMALSKKGFTALRRFILAAAASILLAGCAAYHDVPLPSGPNLANPKAPQHLDLATLLRRALTHSPDLNAQRHGTDAALAEAYAGGLLPDPQFSASVDQPSIHAPGLSNGYVLGLGEDLQALLTTPSRAAGARAKQAQARLGLLWAEWQTMQQSANLYVQKFYGDGKAASLAATAKVLEAQAKHSQSALADHNTTIDVVSSNVSVALDVAGQRDTAVRAALSADADLKSLLAFAPTTVLTLADPGLPQPIAKSAVEQSLAVVADRRPDLLALKAGYHAQSEAVRTAILQQFPSINIGFNHASDTTNVQSNGLSVTINIPIFGTTQANIRSARATRAQMRAEYQARLDQTTADAWRIWRSIGSLRAEVTRLQASVPQLRMMAETGQKAYDAGNLAPATYVLMETTLSARQGDLFDLEAALWTDTIALRTLLAMAPVVPGADGLGVAPARSGP